MLGLEPEAIGGAAAARGRSAEGPLRPLLEAGEPGTTELPLPDGRTAQASVVPVRTPMARRWASPPSSATSRSSSTWSR